MAVVAYNAVIPARWPEADYIVGNPPFIGNKRMRQALGDGYVEAVRGAWPAVPETADFVMYWWHHAAELVREGQARRFGFITTNSITQTFNRGVVQAQLDAGLSIAWAIPDHPWVDAAEGAAVRVAMTVGAPTSVGTAGGLQSAAGQLLTVASEGETVGDVPAITYAERRGVIHANLTIGTKVALAVGLKANSMMSFMGMIPLGAGFWITTEDAKNMGLGKVPDFERHVRRYRNGKDLMDILRDIRALDFYGLSIDDLRTKFPAAFQWLIERVKPIRDKDKRPARRDNWWLYAESVPKWRIASDGLRRYIGTTETAKHRVFVFIDGDILPDQKIRVVASDDALFLGHLSSRMHLVWTKHTGGMLEDRPVYNNSLCFDPFPFPTCPPAQQSLIRQLGEDLDAHRKRQQAVHPGLTLTGMYNVLAKPIFYSSRREIIEIP